MFVEEVVDGPSWSEVMAPIAHLDTSALYHSNITLENTFHSHPDAPPNLLLTLIDRTLLLSDLFNPHLPPQAAVNLDFDLKFTIIIHPQVFLPLPSIPALSVLDYSTMLIASSSSTLFSLLFWSSGVSTSSSTSTKQVSTKCSNLSANWAKATSPQCTRSSAFRISSDSQ